MRGLLLVLLLMPWLSVMALRGPAIEMLDDNFSGSNRCNDPKVFVVENQGFGDEAVLAIGQQFRLYACSPHRTLMNALRMRGMNVRVVDLPKGVL